MAVKKYTTAEPRWLEQYGRWQVNVQKDGTAQNLFVVHRRAQGQGRSHGARDRMAAVYGRG